MAESATPLDVSLDMQSAHWKGYLLEARMGNLTLDNQKAAMMA